MPTPYHELFGYLGAIAAVGSDATASQKAANALIKTMYGANPSPVTLTGSPQSLAILVPPAFVTGQKVILTAVVAGDVTPGSSGQLSVDITEDGVAVINPVVNVTDTNGTGASVSYTIELTPSPGTHSFAVRAHGTGDATFIVAANHGALQATIVTV